MVDNIMEPSSWNGEDEDITDENIKKWKEKVNRRSGI